MFFFWNAIVVQFSRFTLSQIASFAAAAVFSSVWFFRWLRLRAQHKELLNKVWRHFGWYSGLVFAGSVFGAVAWSANIPANALYYDARDPARLNVATARRETLGLLSDHSTWIATFQVSYGFEVMCLSFAQLMILGRLIKHAKSAQPRDKNVKYKRDYRAVYVKVLNCIAAAVAVCGLVGMAASAAGSYYKTESGKLAARAADACSSSGAYTPAAIILALNSSALNKKADQVISVQNTSEMVAMLLIVATYLVVVPICMIALRRTGVFLHSTRNRFAAANAPARLLQAVDADATSSSATSSSAESLSRAQQVVNLTLQATVAQQRRLTAVCVVVFLTFLPRAIFDVIQAIGNQETTLNPKCAVCDTCQSVYLLINIWLRYTSEFRAIAVALSSPLPLSVSLWFMMSEQERELLGAGNLSNSSSSRVEMAAAFAREHMHIDLPLEAPQSPASPETPSFGSTSSSATKFSVVATPKKNLPAHAPSSLGQ